jgi:Flp pilus assembly pilin Flp
MQTIKLLLRDDSGLELTEYAVAAALVIVPLTLAITDLGSSVAAALNALTGEIKDN